MIEVTGARAITLARSSRIRSTPSAGPPQPTAVRAPCSGGCGRAWRKEEPGDRAEVENYCRRGLAHRDVRNAATGILSRQL
jgi:hypothetical protein